MTIKVIEARSSSETKAMYAFLYELWACEFGRELHGMDHEQHMLQDELDSWARHYVAKDSKGEIIGCIRCNTLSNGVLPEELTEVMAEKRLRSIFRPCEVAFSSRLAVSPAARGHSVASGLILAVLRGHLEREVCLDISYATLNLVHMYYQIGSRPYMPAFRIEGVGARQPLAYCLRDLEYLNMVESPTAVILSEENSDKGATAQKLSGAFPLFKDPGFNRVSSVDLWNMIATTQAQGKGFLCGFSAEELERIAPHVVRQLFMPGQYIYRRGEREPGMGVVLSGKLSVELEGKTVAKLGPSEPFGELQSFAGERSADLLALEQSEVLLLPSRLVERVGRADPALGLKLSGRLLEVLGHRLIASNENRLSKKPEKAKSYNFSGFKDQNEELNRLTTQVEAVSKVELPMLEEVGLRDGDRVLDLGSGPGVFSIILAQKYPSCTVAGVEPEEALVSAASDLAASKGLAERVQFSIGSAQRIPLADNSIDFAYVRLLFQHLNNPTEVIEELKRVTKPGGIICILDADDDSIMIHPPVEGWRELERAAISVQESQGGDRHVGRKLQGMLVKLGLEQVSVQQLDVTPQKIGFEPFFGIGFGFKKELLVRGGFWNKHSQEILLRLKEHIQDPSTYARYAGFVASGKVVA